MGAKFTRRDGTGLPTAAGGSGNFPIVVDTESSRNPGEVTEGSSYVKPSSSYLSPAWADNGLTKTGTLGRAG